VSRERAGRTIASRRNVSRTGKHFQSFAPEESMYKKVTQNNIENLGENLPLGVEEALEILSEDALINKTFFFFEK
jgi:hypothetical protein